jgi:hypothetical protein
VCEERRSSVSWKRNWRDVDVQRINFVECRPRRLVGSHPGVSIFIYYCTNILACQLASLTVTAASGATFLAWKGNIPGCQKKNQSCLVGRNCKSISWFNFGSVFACKLTELRQETMVRLLGHCRYYVALCSASECEVGPCYSFFSSATMTYF